MSTVRQDRFAPERIHLENILNVMSDETFSKDLSAKIVGGVTKLERLVASGEIACVKATSAQNSKWRCNAAQVLRHCKNTRTT